MSAFAKVSTSRSRALKATIGGAALLASSALILSGCAAGSGDTSTSSASGSASATALDLKIGTILPQTGSLAVLGPPEFAGVDLAIQDINAAKSGLTISVTHKDSGDATTDIAKQSAAALIADNVSAIIGAASSGVSKTFIDAVTGAGIVQMSPANTSPDFTDYPDDGYYWRTAPSDVLQGRILGNKIVSDKITSVGILYLNDPYGTGLEKNLKSTLDANGVTITKEATFETAATDFTSSITGILASKPDALVVISFDELTTIAAQLKTQGFDFSKFYGTDGNFGVITPADKNVDIAGAQFTNPGVNASTEFQDKLQALVKTQGGKPLTVFSYAPEAYDATTLIALAALQGKKTDGATIKANLQTVSEGGTKCKSYAECAPLVLAGKNIDYDGLSGPITFDKNGDPTEAYISIYKYGKGNVSTYEDAVYGKLG